MRNLAMRFRGRGTLCVRLCSLTLAALAIPAEAWSDLVIMVDGAVLRAARVEVGATRVTVELEGGGRLAVPLLDVERIVDDEVVEPGGPEPGSPPLERLPIRFEPGQRLLRAVPYAEIIAEVAERHGLHPELVATVVEVESAFQARAISPKGARGLMQLMPATARRLGVSLREIFDPARNLDAGARYLRWLADRYADDLERMLAGYNAGEGAVDRYGGVPPYRETRAYVERIASLFRARVAPADLPSTTSVESSSRGLPRQ